VKRLSAAVRALPEGREKDRYGWILKDYENAKKTVGEKKFMKLWNSPTWDEKLMAARVEKYRDLIGPLSNTWGLKLFRPA
jgi:hypothetical protein